mgnify:CR=1 FL=1
MALLITDECISCGACLPECPNEAIFETKVAYLKFKFSVTVEVTRTEEPSEIEAKIEGMPLGLVGRLTALGRDEGDAVAVEADGIGGVPDPTAEFNAVVRRGDECADQ